MPPAVPVAVAVGVAGASSFTFTAPAATKARDTLLAILQSADSAAGPEYTDELLDEWTEIATFTGSGSKLWILRREALASDTGNIEIPFDDIGAIGLLAVYRNLNTGADVVDSDSSAITASSSFACPSLDLVTYSDLYLGIVLVNTAATGVTAPAGCTERAEEQDSAMTLELFDLLAEDTGATGVQTATTAAPQTGIAASLALAADPFVGFGLSFSFDPVGGIGLPSKGI
jgi:hypothetical protein